MKQKKFDIYKDRENIEWTNTWVEDCQDPDKERILLIGDSVLRNIRGKISGIINESADFIGTSRSFADPCFFNIFDCFFQANPRNYSKILVNLGINHGHFFNVFQNEQEQSLYKEYFEKFIKNIKQNANYIVIISGTTWVYKDNILKFDTQKNDEIRTKNKIQSEIAQKYKTPFIDLYSHIMSNIDYYVFTDHVHFKSIKITDYTAKYIVSNIYPEISVDFSEKPRRFKKFFHHFLQVIHKIFK